MDSQYLTFQNTELIRCSNFIIFNSDAAAKLYLDTCYDDYCNIIIVSIEGGYPLTNNLTLYAMSTIQSNENCNIIVMGADILQRIDIKSKKILIMDDFILSQRFGFQISPTMLTHLIKSFCEQDKKILLGNNFKDGYTNYKAYNSIRDNTLVKMLI